MPLLLPYLMILFSSFAGWLIVEMFIWLLFRPYTPKKIISFTFSGILPRLQLGMSKEIAAAIVKKYLSAETISEKISNQAILLQIKPEIENHVDRFLKDRLPEDFPLLSKFMGEKTLSKFKQSFLSEVEVIFPVMLKSYTGKMMNEWEPEKIIENELNAISIPAIKKAFYKKASRQLLSLKLMGAAIGFFIGLIQLIILFIML